MQRMYALWERIPAAKRGGTVADLSDLLLDKMPRSCATYCQYVRAFAAVNKRSLDDYQGIVRMLIKLHTEETVSKQVRLMGLNDSGEQSSRPRAYLVESQGRGRQSGGAGQSQRGGSSSSSSSGGNLFTQLYKCC